MSVINGKINYTVVKPEKMPYGETLKASRILPAEGAMDIAQLDGNHLVVAEKGVLSVYTVTADGEELCGRCEGFGASRQLAISAGYAYVTTRSGGIYVFDVRNPAEPKLINNLDSLELATGICAADGILAVTNRHMGTELWDIRNPENPVFLSDFQCGEAQSVWLAGDIAFVGDWMNRQVRIFSIANPRQPKFMSVYGVDGFADGVCAIPYKDGLLGFCATGHHAARLKNRKKYDNAEYVTPEMFADGYGCGHGLEIFDVTTPRDPEFLSTSKTPPHFGGIDSWRVFTDGKTAYLTDSMGGAFALSLDDPTAPQFLWHYRVVDFSIKVRTVPTTIQSPAECIMGLATMAGRVYAVTPTSGIHVLEVPENPAELKRPWVTVDWDGEAPENPENCIAKSAGQLHSFACVGDTLYCSAGEKGIEKRTLSGELLTTYPTADICHDILYIGGKLLIADGDKGIASYAIDGGKLTECGRLATAGEARELVALSETLVAVETASSGILSVQITADGQLTQTAKFPGGLLYFRHLARTATKEYLIGNPLALGPQLWKITENGIDRTPYARPAMQLCPIEEGMCGGKNGFYFIKDRWYGHFTDPAILLDIPETLWKRVDGADLRGEPFLFDEDNRLVLLERCTGIVEVLDVADPEKPKFLWHTILAGMHPEFAQIANGKLLVCCGRGGILQFDW